MKATRIGQTGIKNGSAAAKSNTSTVYKVLLKDKTEGEMNVAVKEYMLPSHKENEESRAIVEDTLAFFFEDFEKSLMVVPPHPNLVRYWGLEYLPGMANGNLDRLMLTCDWVDHNKLKGPLPEDQVRDIIAGALQGLAHLHKAGISHDDVRPCNIFVTNIWRRRNPGDAVDKPHAVLTDYSIFKKIQEVLDPTGGNPTTKQAPSYVAPEVFSEGKDYDVYKADVWGMAATALSLLSGTEPWSELGKGVIMFKILGARTPPKYPEGLSGPCKSFLDTLFDRNFRNRPTAAEALTLEWLKDAK
eukprot:GILI01000269.1.p1 GENE.GILI01000269.1~~GILI01000269.1.p1  ORF type:complete len:301 (-),score=84.27 GILI01000269.1:90-992(-)